jgi:hypothetical protein
MQNASKSFENYGTGGMLHWCQSIQTDRESINGSIELPSLAPGFLGEEILMGG